jgi:hypothetical protein
VDPVLLVCSAVLATAAAPPYLYQTIKGSVRPERASWFIFSVLGVIAFVSQLSLGARTSLIFNGIDTFGSITIFILSFWYGVGGWTRLDRIVLALASLGVLISLSVHRPLIALLGVVIADACGMVPTIHKAYIEPDSESQLAWLLFATAGVFTILTIHNLRFDLLIYPVYIAIANYSVPVAMRLGRSRCT